MARTSRHATCSNAALFKRLITVWTVNPEDLTFYSFMYTTVNFRSFPVLLAWIKSRQNFNDQCRHEINFIFVPYVLFFAPELIFTTSALLITFSFFFSKHLSLLKRQGYYSEVFKKAFSIVVMNFLQSVASWTDFYLILPHTLQQQFFFYKSKININTWFLIHLNL